MERFVKADIVVVPFPFSDLSDSKRRPALVLVDLIGDDIILCQITSKNFNDIYSIPLSQNDFSSGSIVRPSNLHPNRLFTADKNIILKKTGQIKKEKYSAVTESILELIQL